MYCTSLSRTFASLHVKHLLHPGLHPSWGLCKPGQSHMQKALIKMQFAVFLPKGGRAEQSRAGVAAVPVVVTVPLLGWWHRGRQIRAAHIFQGKQANSADLTI